VILAWNAKSNRDAEVPFTVFRADGLPRFILQFHHTIFMIWIGDTDAARNPCLLYCISENSRSLRGLNCFGEILMNKQFTVVILRNLRR
jgi:hypothetical protein